MMGLTMCEGKFVGRDEIALVPTPTATASWKPVPHSEVIDAVTDVVKAHNWQILDEQYGLARDGQRMFGFMRISKTHSPEWSRCIGIRNSHDQSIAVGLAAGLCVKVCSNLMLGGSMVLKRRHTSRIELNGLVLEAVEELETEFLTLETVAEDLKCLYVREDAARIAIVKAAEAGAVNSSDILPIFREFKEPQHEEFAEPTRWSLLNAFTENAKKYSPARADVCYRGLTRLFGLDGQPPTLWK
ncbi:DUF932 domain-containing protein [Victivallis lenta]|uniref:DUF932 domain-containing protein n=1 Tax=Victivallis lenta TaxID=2606640 RepID=UPI0015AF7A17|nr:DUF932 domain-containing protein [Victivallis lenta]